MPPLQVYPIPCLFYLFSCTKRTVFLYWLRNADTFRFSLQSRFLTGDYMEKLILGHIVQRPVAIDFLWNFVSYI